MVLAKWPPGGGEATNDNLARDHGAPPSPRSRAISVNRALADYLRADAELLTSGSRWSPVIADRRLLGFELLAVPPGSLMDVFGFRAGDVVEWSDAQPVQWTGDELRFRVRREGRSFVIVLHVSDA